MVLESNIDEILPQETVLMILESNIDKILPQETVFMVLESNIDTKNYLRKLYLWF